MGNDTWEYRSSITIVAGFLAFYSQKPDNHVFFFALFAVAALGLRDAHYLRLEKGYRSLYEAARTAPSSAPIDFHLTPDMMAGEGFYDASIWENAKRSGDDSLKDLIRKGIDNTSVTCVLSGADTWQRRWVRYEIARSLVKDNALLAVHISGLQCMRDGAGTRSPNPLANMGVYRDPQSCKGSICEWNSATAKWVYYGNYITAISWPTYLPEPAIGTIQPLNLGTLEYDYAQQDGYRNFSGWVATPAADAGRSRNKDRLAAVFVRAVKN